MTSTFAIAARLTVVTLLLTGFAYPLVVTGLARLFFPTRASGSLVHDEAGRVVGSALIGQRFTAPGYFQGRPSAAGADGYDATASSGSNLGPTSAKLRERIDTEVRRLRELDPGRVDPPAELLFASASGLDPHLSPAAAHWQVGRVALARGLAAERVRALVDELAEGRTLRFLGEPRVNVLTLNLALDRRFGPATLGE